MSVLSHQTILDLCDFNNRGNEEAEETDTGIITPCLRRNVRSAGYNLRLGNEYYLPEHETGSQNIEKDIKELDGDKRKDLVIPPNRVIILSILETLNLPDNIVGRLSLKVDILLKGVIMANQSQIDAGYKGKIYLLLFNLSSKDVYIRHGDPILRLELSKLDKKSDLPYAGKYEALDSLKKALVTPLGSSLFAVQEDLRIVKDENKNTIDLLKNETKDEIRKAQLLGGFVLGLVALMTTAFTYLGPLVLKVNSLEASYLINEKRFDDKMKSLEDSIKDKSIKVDTTGSANPATSETAPSPENPQIAIYLNEVEALKTDLSQKQIEINTLKNQIYRQQLFGIIGSVILFSVLIYLYYRISSSVRK